MDNLYTPYLIDLSLYQQLNSESFKEQTDRVGKVFYSNSNVLKTF